MRPNRPSTSATSFSTWLASVTSALKAAMSPCSDWTMVTVGSSNDCLISAAAIRAPSRANKTAADRPFPQPGPTDPAPVMRATLPSSRPVMPAPPHAPGRARRHQVR